MSEALGTAGANIPEDARHGGITVKFVQSSDNKYVSYRLMATSFSTTESDWQGVDDEPTAGSNNLVKSGGVQLNIGTPIIKSVTTSSVNVNCQININLPAGTKIFCKTFIENAPSTASAILRIHHTDNTWNPNNSSEGTTKRNGGTLYFELDKDADYVQFVRSNTAVNGATYTLELYTGVYAQHEYLKNNVNELPTRFITTNYGKFCCQYPISYSYDSNDNSFTINISSPKESNGAFGYIILTDGTTMDVKCQSDGNGGYIKNYVVERLKSIVADKDTGVISVVDNNGLEDNYFLFRHSHDTTSEITALERTTGALSEIFKFNKLNSLISTNSGNISTINNELNYSKEIETSSVQTSSGYSIDAVINQTFVKGTLLYISATLSKEQNYSILLRVRNKELQTYTNIGSITSGVLVKHVLLDNDIDQIQFVKYNQAEEDTIAKLKVVAGFNALADTLDLDQYSASASVSGTAINAQITHTFKVGQTLLIEATNSDIRQGLYVRAHYADGSGFKTFRDLAQYFAHYYTLYVVEKDIDYIQIINNFCSYNVNAALSVYEGDINARIAENAAKITDVNINLQLINGRQDTVFIPTYYDEQITEKTIIARDRILGVSGIADSFIFITDAHWNGNTCKSPLLISSLLRKGLSRKVLFGGDVCSATTPQDSEWAQPLEIQQQMLLNGMVHVYGKIINVRGNHDFNGSKNNILPGQSGSDNYEWNQNVTRRLLLQEDNITTEGTDGSSNYYYYDDNIAKIRYFVLYAIETSSQFSAAQEEWFINAVENIPLGYDIVVANHDGCVNTTGLECPTACPDVMQIVNAIDNKERGNTNINSVAYDFTEITAKVLLFISGHTHADLQTFVGNVPHVATVCDANFIGTVPAFLGGDSTLRTAGTYKEQAFDHVVIDKANGNIFFTRIGAGGDRVFKTSKIIVSIGDTTELTTELEGTITWGSYDNDTDWHIAGNNYSPSVPANTKVSVSNGNVTGVAAGQSVVYAKDENGNREFFNVVVS